MEQVGTGLCRTSAGNRWPPYRRSAGATDDVMTLESCKQMCIDNRQCFGLHFNSAGTYGHKCYVYTNEPFAVSGNWLWSGHRDSFGEITDTDTSTGECHKIKLVINAASDPAPTTCAFQESDDIFVKRAAMCGGEVCVAIKNDQDRTGVMWGRHGSVNVDLKNAAQITCGYKSCVVLRTDGSAEGWGPSSHNLGLDALNLPSRNDIAVVDCGYYACVALTTNGDALFWGSASTLGDLTPGTILSGQNLIDAGCGGSACWVKNANSEVQVWGRQNRGLQGTAPAQALVDVKKIQCGGGQCISITNAGKLYVWGRTSYGGPQQPNYGDAIIVDAMCGEHVCIAFSTEGRVFTWGRWFAKDNIPPSDLSDTDVVVKAHCGVSHCLVILDNGRMISWGDPNLTRNYQGPYENVKEAHCTGYLCVGLKNDGSVFSWGYEPYMRGYSDLVSQGVLNSGIAKVQCGTYACLAISDQGTGYTWGPRNYGGNSDNVDLTNIAFEFPCSSSAATDSPTMNPTNGPTLNPSSSPTNEPTVNPSSNPTNGPTLNPSLSPTNEPTLNPSLSPTNEPTFNPSSSPSNEPTLHPSLSPTNEPTESSDSATNCAFQESDDILVKRAAMCGGEVCVAIKNDQDRTGVIWGRHGSVNVDLKNAAQITCGYKSCAVVRTDGSAQGWGPSSHNLGLDALNLPARNDIAVVDCGYYACVALTTSGDALFWGSAST